MKQIPLSLPRPAVVTAGVLLVILGALFAASSPAVGQPVTAGSKRSGSQSKVSPSRRFVSVRWVEATRNSDQVVMGNIRATMADGITKLLTQKGNCGKDAQLSPDGRIAGWCEGKILGSKDNQWFVGTRLVLHSEGKPNVICTGKKAFIEGWRFGSDGSSVVLKSRNGHGPATIELHDATSGKLKATVNAFDEQETTWAKGLYDSR